VILLTGGFLGLLAGVLFSILTFLGLLNMPARHLFAVTGTLITFLAAGIGSPIRCILGTGWRHQHSRHSGVGYIHYIVGQEYPGKVVTHASRIRRSAQHIASSRLHRSASDDFCFVQDICTSSTAPLVPLKELRLHFSPLNGNEGRSHLAGGLLKLRSRSSSWWNGNDRRNKDHVLRKNPRSRGKGRREITIALL
jgi:hypothetical protein